MTLVPAWHYLSHMTAVSSGGHYTALDTLYLLGPRIAIISPCSASYWICFSGRHHAEFTPPRDISSCFPRRTDHGLPVLRSFSRIHSISPRHVLLLRHASGIYVMNIYFQLMTRDSGLCLFKAEHYSCCGCSEPPRAICQLHSYLYIVSFASYLRTLFIYTHTTYTQLLQVVPHFTHQRSNTHAHNHPLIIPTNPDLRICDNLHITFTHSTRSIHTHSF